MASSAQREIAMPHVVNEKCILCKYTDCVEVCPVDCFYEGQNMLVINPDECIDCGVCIPECPAEAIVTDADVNFEEKWLALNARYSAVWPNISRRKEPLEDADANNGRADKFAFFDPAPGEDEQ